MKAARRRTSQLFIDLSQAPTNHTILHEPHCRCHELHSRLLLEEQQLLQQLQRRNSRAESLRVKRRALEAEGGRLLRGFARLQKVQRDLAMQKGRIEKAEEELTLATQWLNYAKQTQQCLLQF